MNNFDGRLKTNAVATARQRAQRMLGEIEQQIQGGQWKPGQALPSENALGQSYGVSRSTAHNVLAQLASRHLIHQVRGVGAFVGAAESAARIAAESGSPRALDLPDSSPGLFLISPGAEPDALRVESRIGFEERIARAGAASLVLPRHEAEALAARGGLPLIAGVFGGRSAPVEADYFAQAPLVCHREEEPGDEDRDASRLRLSLSAGFDSVSFDDVDGGRQATQHLLNWGHTRIAFIGLHRDASTFLWSKARARGWREALQAAGCPPGSEALWLQSPRGEGDAEAQTEAGFALAQQLEQHPEVTALVAANDFVALGVIRWLREKRKPLGDWPAMVGFDATDIAAELGLTSLRLPWDVLGASAAELLLDRACGRLSGPPQERRVQMRLINRASSSQPWPEAMRARLTTWRITPNASPPEPEVAVATISRSTST